MANNGILNHNNAYIIIILYSKVPRAPPISKWLLQLNHLKTTQIIIITLIPIQPSLTQ